MSGEIVTTPPVHHSPTLNRSRIRDVERGVPAVPAVPVQKKRGGVVGGGVVGAVGRHLHRWRAKPGLHCEDFGRSVTASHQVARWDNFLASRFARESDAAAGVTRADQAGMCDSRPGVTVVVGAIRLHVIRFACHSEARELPL